MAWPDSQAPDYVVLTSSIGTDSASWHCRRSLTKGMTTNQLQNTHMLNHRTGVMRLLAQNPNNSAAREQRDKAVADRDRLLTVR